MSLDSEVSVSSGVSRGITSRNCDCTTLGWHPGTCRKIQSSPLSRHLWGSSPCGDLLGGVLGAPENKADPKGDGFPLI